MGKATKIRLKEMRFDQVNSADGVIFSCFTVSIGSVKQFLCGLFCIIDAIKYKIINRK